MRKNFQYGKLIDLKVQIYSGPLRSELGVTPKNSGDRYKQIQHNNPRKNRSATPVLASIARLARFLRPDIDNTVAIEPSASQCSLYDYIQNVIKRFSRSPVTLQGL